jgi:DMSO/TMAO reductase YedYZ heme-binding membrane subunit
VRAGSDNALRLAALLPYVGVDPSYTLARALGITALVFAYLAVVTGLLGRSRGGSLHRHLGLLTLALAVAHATVPFTSVDAPYGGWRTVLVPFAQPGPWGPATARWVSLGIIAAYLLVLTGPTYWLVGNHRRAWAAVHRTAVAVYGLAAVHTFMLGSDFLVRGPARVLLLAAQVPLAVLGAVRLSPPQGAPHRAARRLGSAGTAAGAALLAVLTVLVATGEYSPGMRL